MALKRKSAKSSDISDDKPSILDRLTDLRNDITNSDGLTELLDILIDANGGDATALAEERASAASETVETVEEPDPAAPDDNP
jgi:hypothetical protein